MLYLSRKINETVMIGNNISVTVMKMEDGKVMLGFEAPKIISIDREEVFERKRQKKQANDYLYPSLTK